MANKPNIRFKGFTDDWEQRKLGEMSNSYSGGTPKVGTSKYYGGKIPFIRSAEINSDTTELFLTEEGLKCSSARLVDTGDILYALYGATSGEVGRARIKGAINQAILVIKPQAGYDYEFLTQWLRKSKLNIIDRYLQGGQGNLSGTIVNELLVEFPNYEEQTKIGTYFSTLDHLITLHQRKCDETKKLKKFMLQKMFPKNGEKNPEIRFAGFTDDWEQRKLGDILERRIEQRRQSADYPRLAFASGQGVIPLSERKTNNREQLTKDEFTKKYLVTEMNDIVYNPANVKYGAIDRNKFGRGLISPIYVTFTTREDAGFIERIVTSHEFQQKALRFEEGTVTKRQSVNPEDFVLLDILLASNKSEQKKVSVFFDTLDRLITLHQRKCDKLKLIKKFMLQNMFPKKG